MAFPHYHQLEARDCGPACLKIIAKYYGKTYSMSEIKDYCSVTRIGVSLQDIINGAEKLGFETLAAKFTTKNLSEMPLPCILFWRQEHYVVLYKINEAAKGSKFYISDPSFGRIYLNQESFEKQWLDEEDKGIALLLEPVEKFSSFNPVKERKDKSIGKLANLLAGILKNNKTRSLIALILVCIAMISTWIFPTIFRKIIDQGIMGKNMNVVFFLVAAQLVVFLSQTISDNISSIMIMQINFKVSLQFLVGYLHKLIKLPLKIFDTKVNSDLMLRMEDSDRIQSFLTHYSLELFLSGINLIIFSFMLFHYNTLTFGVYIVMSCLSIAWTLLFLSKRKVIDYSRFSVSSETRNNIYELINEMPEIKINNAHNNKIRQWENLQGKLNKINMNALLWNYYQLIGANFFNRIKDIFITAICAYFVIHGTMTLGVMMTISFILGQLNGPINSLINLSRSVQDAKLSFERLEDIQRLENEDIGKDMRLIRLPSKEITVSNLSFKYEGSFSPFVLHNVNLVIPVGKVTAIVGASGSGKTTLMKLLLSIYDPTEGEIHLDSLPLRSINPDNWRTKCGVVLQNGYIYSGSYAQNIALADEFPDLEKIKEVCKLVCLDEFIEGLPLKYHTQIGKTGIDLSGGQKQKILIARAIYRDPKFIFLDEATSSLDANNEKYIINNLKSLFKGKTVLIIAHRLSTVKNADQIIVMEKGRIVEMGNHYHLTSDKGKYFELVKNQLELGD